MMAQAIALIAGYVLAAALACAVLFGATSCAGMVVEKPYKLDQTKCVTDDMFPPEANFQPEYLIRTNQGLPPKTYRGLQNAHVACHNEERHAIEENQKRVVENGDRVESPILRAIKDTSAYILWGAVAIAIVVGKSKAAAIAIKLVWLLL